MADAEGLGVMESPLLDTIYQNGVDLVDAVTALLDAGADPNVITKYCESPLRVSSNLGRFDVVGLLLGSGADPAQLGWTALFSEIAFGTLESIKPLLDQGADLTARDFWNRTPWLLALQVGDVAKAELLLVAG